MNNDSSFPKEPATLERELGRGRTHAPAGSVKRPHPPGGGFEIVPSCELHRPRNSRVPAWASEPDQAGAHHSGGGAGSGRAGSPGEGGANRRDAESAEEKLLRHGGHGAHRGVIL
jgi:hypothetical protein